MEDNIVLQFPSLYWISTTNFTFMSIKSGLCRLLCREYKADELFTLIEKYKVKYMNLAPHLLLNLVQSGRPITADITSLKTVITGGGPITGEQIISVREYLPGKTFSLVLKQIKAYF